tara:strand:+ start:266 stop:496 length:231 start_codon:yes stop_codon:yes gene_type:complete
MCRRKSQKLPRNRPGPGRQKKQAVKDKAANGSFQTLEKPYARIDRHLARPKIARPKIARLFHIFPPPIICSEISWG